MRLSERRRAIGMKCLGIEDSFEGILGEPKKYAKLTKKSVGGLLPRGGTILEHEIAEVLAKMVDGKVVFLNYRLAEALDNLKNLEIEALVIAIGGERNLA